MATRLWLASVWSAILYLEYDYSADRLSVRWVDRAMASKGLSPYIDNFEFLTPTLAYSDPSESSQDIGTLNARNGMETRHPIRLRGNHVVKACTSSSSKTSK
ncbi:hypothetical protein VTN49DRAFT_2308 [Thermomyces lanuginosus]|uniref:uncharacterized protein n=1 Tax=Thermomyces lanuginosus TaxID=5541 RepID=UPI0037442199